MKKVLIILLLSLLTLQLIGCTKEEGLTQVSEIEEDPIKVDELITEVVNPETTEAPVDLTLPDSDYSVTYYRDFVFNDGSVHEGTVMLSIVGYNYYTAEEITALTGDDYVFGPMNIAADLKISAAIKFEEGVNAYDIKPGQVFPKFNFIGAMPGGPGLDMTEPKNFTEDDIRLKLNTTLKEGGDQLNMIILTGRLIEIRLKSDDPVNGIIITPKDDESELLYLELPNVIN